jgi:hypothetical protein
MLFEGAIQHAFPMDRFDALPHDGVGIDMFLEQAVGVVDEGHSARHAGAKLSPTGPRITANPPVIYSQPLEPQPSMTAKAAPELRTAKRSPA